MNIFDSLERAQIRFPNKEALIFKGQRTTYGELYQQACRLSAALSRSFGLRRGDRVAMGSLQFIVPIKGPLLGRFELATGSTGAELPRFPGGGWTAGVRAGLGAETPVGPVRFEYGVALRGRSAFLVRVGRWF